MAIFFNDLMTDYNQKKRKSVKSGQSEIHGNQKFQKIQKSGNPGILENQENPENRDIDWIRIYVSETDSDRREIGFCVEKW